MNPCLKLCLPLFLLSLVGCLKPRADAWPSQVKTALAGRTTPLSPDELADYEAGFRDGAEMVHQALKAGRRPFRPVPDAPALAPQWRGATPEGVVVEPSSPAPEVDAESGLQQFPASFAKSDVFARGQVDGFSWALSAIGQGLVRPVPPLAFPSQWVPFAHPQEGQELEAGPKTVRLLWAPGHLAWAQKERGFPSQRTWRLWDEPGAPAWISLSEQALWVESPQGHAYALDLESGGILAVRSAIPHAPPLTRDWHSYQEDVIEEYKAPAFQRKLASLREAAASGQVADLLAVARHLSGMGVEAEREAFGWYLMAAELGQPEAMLKVGVMFFHGEATTGDKAAAHAWLERAIQGGQPEAKAVMDLLFEGTAAGGSASKP